jgi:hypothetical protein
MVYRDTIWKSRSPYYYYYTIILSPLIDTGPLATKIESSNMLWVYNNNNIIEQKRFMRSRSDLSILTISTVKCTISLRGDMCILQNIRTVSNPSELGTGSQKLTYWTFRFWAKLYLYKYLPNILVTKLYVFILFCVCRKSIVFTFRSSQCLHSCNLKDGFW